MTYVIRHQFVRVACVVLLAIAVVGCGEAATEPPATTQSPAPTQPAPGGTDGSLVSNTPGGADPAGGGSATGGSATLPPLADDSSDAPDGGLLGSIDGALFQPKAKLDTASDTTGADSSTFDGSSSGTDSSDTFTQDSQFTDTTGSGSDSDTTSTKTYTSAKVSVNSKVHTLQKQSVFPSDSQQFRVTAIGADYVIIELMAGVFADGSNAVTLEQGKSRKFVNQDERVSYTLELQSTS
jgi:hypothetical protein